MQALGARIHKIEPTGRSDVGRNGTLSQVQRLLTIALRQIGQRFAEVDAQTSEVTAALRNLESQQAFIRANRDSLYRSLRAWDPLLTEWQTTPSPPDDGFWTLLARFYAFLASRYMPVQEWQTARFTRQRNRKPERVMTW